MAAASRLVADEAGLELRDVRVQLLLAAVEPLTELGKVLLASLELVAAQLQLRIGTDAVLVELLLTD